jgi:hypothetical protein
MSVSALMKGWYGQARAAIHGRAYLEYVGQDRRGGRHHLDDSVQHEVRPAVYVVRLRSFRPEPALPITVGLIFALVCANTANGMTRQRPSTNQVAPISSGYYIAGLLARHLRASVTQRLPATFSLQTECER